MPAAMLHGGGGMLLMMTTKFASQQTIKQSRYHKLLTKCNQSPLPHNNIQLKTTSQNHKQKQTIATHTLLHQTKLTGEIQLFQMKKMHQR